MSELRIRPPGSKNRGRRIAVTAGAAEVAPAGMHGRIAVKWMGDDGADPGGQVHVRIVRGKEEAAQQSDWPLTPRLPEFFDVTEETHIVVTGSASADGYVYWVDASDPHLDKQGTSG